MSVTKIQDPERLRSLLEAVMLLESTLDLDDLLRELVERARSLVGAQYGALGVLNELGTGLESFITRGMSDAGIAAIGPLPTGKGVLGTVIHDAESLRLAEVSQHDESTALPKGHPDMHEFLGAPVRVRGSVYGNLYLCNHEGGFSDEDEAVIVTLASAAGLAIQTSRLYAQSSDAAALRARETVARDLHDTVLQRIFAHTLSLSTLGREIGDGESSAAIVELTTELAETVKLIRSTIFDLHPSNEVLPLDQVVNDSLAGLRPMFPFELKLQIEGAQGLLLDQARASALTAVLREGLTNVVRHSGAKHCTVLVKVAEEICVTIEDDGQAPPSMEASGGRGLGNLSHRAASLGGHCEFTRSARGGILLWTCSLPKA
ncbi:MAG: GAF domain-containing protein [Actinobacteria bacterium]|nr:GAF domain-containing protein [Actinomycetota bacterium]